MYIRGVWHSWAACTLSLYVQLHHLVSDVFLYALYVAISGDERS